MAQQSNTGILTPLFNSKEVDGDNQSTPLFRQLVSLQKEQTYMGAMYPPHISKINDSILMENYCIIFMIEPLNVHITFDIENKVIIQYN